MMRYIIFSCLFILSHGMNAQTQKPDSTNEVSAIKSLSAEEVRGLKQGMGMGLAKVAELNSYPGPMHVLGLAKELKLSPAQKQKIEEARKAMKFKAVEMGEFIITEEKKLNALFASGKADEGSIIYYTNKIGLYNAELRNAHLQAHLKTRRILTPDQINKYKKLRGYSD